MQHAAQEASAAVEAILGAEALDQLEALGVPHANGAVVGRGPDGVLDTDQTVDLGLVLVNDLDLSVGVDAQEHSRNVMLLGLQRPTSKCARTRILEGLT